MEQPSRFVAQEEIGKVCRLRKSLYGLKQSPRAWFDKFSQAVETFDMLKSNSNHSIFYKNSLLNHFFIVSFTQRIYEC